MHWGYCREYSTKSVGRITQVSEGSTAVLSEGLKRSTFGTGMSQYSKTHGLWQWHGTRWGEPFQPWWEVMVWNNIPSGPQIETRNCDIVSSQRNLKCQNDFGEFDPVSTQWLLRAIWRGSIIHIIYTCRFPWMTHLLSWMAHIIYSIALFHGEWELLIIANTARCICV